ncbi:MAG: glycoside hydrolase family 28 protein [Clostridia bacterium]|nr:glycoside hydrolase family 28 protein [Clostridia bacterium]
MLFNVYDFSARGDGLADDAPFIQNAIDACFEGGGGRVLLPHGTFLAGHIQLKSNVELHIAHGVVLKTYPDKARLAPAFLDVPNAEYTLGFIWAHNAENVAVTGSGTIDGNGDAFVDLRLCENGEEYLIGSASPRPVTVIFDNCKHSTFRDFTIKDGSFWTLHCVGCDDVSIHDIRILGDMKMANNDGIDIDHCRNVRISGCHIQTADDAICLKNSQFAQGMGDCENITVTNCTLRSTSSAIKLGTGSFGVFRNITVTNCAIFASNRGISVQIRDCGGVENLLISDCTVQTRRHHPDWWGQAEPIYITTINRTEDMVSGHIRNVIMKNIACTGENGILICSEEPGKITDVMMESVCLDLRKTTDWPPGRYDLRPSYIHLAPSTVEEPGAVTVCGASRVRIRGLNITADEALRPYHKKPLACYNAEDIIAEDVYYPAGGNDA